MTRPSSRNSGLPLGLGVFGIDTTRIDTENDIALCKTMKNPFLAERTKDFVQAVKLDGTIPPDGMEVCFTGFPLHTRIPISGHGIVASLQALPSSGEKHSLTLLLHAEVWPGTSGSPLFLEDGRVIGLMAAMGTGSSQGISYARPARFITALLDNQRKLHFHPPPRPRSLSVSGLHRYLLQTTKQLPKRHAKSFGNSSQVYQRNIPLPSLDATVVRPIHSTPRGSLFLRNS